MLDLNNNFMTSDHRFREVARLKIVYAHGGDGPEAGCDLSPLSGGGIGST